MKLSGVHSDLPSPLCDVSGIGEERLRRCLPDAEHENVALPAPFGT
jgi:hypothetical protein